jgi:hypothetical protein
MFSELLLSLRLIEAEQIRERVDVPVPDAPIPGALETTQPS